MVRCLLLPLLIAILGSSTLAFTTLPSSNTNNPTLSTFPTTKRVSPIITSTTPFLPRTTTTATTTTTLKDVTSNLEIVGLVAGQENYGLAIVALGEAFWSFAEAPSLANAKVIIPAAIAAAILIGVAGPMITSGVAGSVGVGLEVATVVSLLLGVSYVLRLLAPYSPSAKEICFLGLLFALAGFFSFSQNLVVNGFVTLPSLPSIPLPSLPTIELPSF
mmetsp:Transcript_28951/g.35211  ORF Transcript_28951/g.35211 Transcript_28951/m.35211 type:complete len:218 (+) Transcript_28951:77-730(+)